MGNLTSAKIAGGIGAILTVVGFGFIGFILKAIGVKEIADEMGDGHVFRDFLLAAVLWVSGLLLLFILFILALLSGSFFIFGISLSLAVGAIVLLLGSWFLRRSYYRIAEATGVKYFRTAALLYVVGAALAFIGVGALVIFAAAIVEVVAFLSLPEELPVRRRTMIDDFSFDSF